MSDLMEYLFGNIGFFVVIFRIHVVHHVWITTYRFPTRNMRHLGKVFVFAFSVGNLTQLPYYFLAKDVYIF